MKDVLEAVDAWTARDEAVALATVVAVKRSAPRPPGAKMAVNGAGEVAGAVSGGCVEGAVVAAAEEVLRGAPPRLLAFGIADEEAWEVGLPCGGEIEVWVERHAPGPHEPAGAFARLARDGGRGALVTVLAGERAGAKLLLAADGAQAGGLGDPLLEAAAREQAEVLMWGERSERRELAGSPVLVDVTFPAPRLIVVGAADFAAALCRLARGAGWRPYVVDPRGRFASPARFPEAEAVVVAWPEEAFARLGGIDRATFVAVLTHDPKLDDAALRIALRSEAAYVGAMGSRRAQARRRERLLAAGVPEADLARMAAPIGLDLGALSAEETALSIMAEVVAVRHGHGGGRLAHAEGRIHEVGV